jgi:hypothetical protein
LGGRHLGAIAQLEERLVCIQKARGSSPLSSTGQRLVAILRPSEQSQTKSQSRRTIRHMASTARRGHGEGSVYRDAVNGTWVGAISLGWRPDGSRIRRKVTGRTKTEVREKLKKLQAEADAGLKTSASYTVAKAVDDWAAEALDGLADKTVRSHVDLLRPVTMLMSGAR